MGRQISLVIVGAGDRGQAEVIRFGELYQDPQGVTQ